MKIKLKHFLLGIFIALGLLIGVLSSFPDAKLHLVFCDVGQGDAIYIRTPKGSDILIDAGPNEKVLDCLGKHLPFYDRDIELMVLTHPHADHFTGLTYVLERYSVKKIVLENIYAPNEKFEFFRQKVAEEGAEIYNPKAGDKIVVDNVELESFWPREVIGDKRMWNTEYLGGVSRESQVPQVSREEVLGASTVSGDLNKYSLVLLLKHNDFRALLTGDSGQEVLSNISELKSLDRTLDVLKIPHHGSKTSLSTTLLDQLKPKTAIISVGKNSFGHPAEEIIEKLSNKGIKILRTDKDGEIEISN